MSLPDKIDYDPLDDTSGIDVDLDVLYNKFITPIDSVRSFAAPTVTERPVSANGSVGIVSDTANIDPSEPQESRAHAFYRMIGFPIISQNLDFYNPGFDPTLSIDDRFKNMTVSSNLSPAVRLAHQQRENFARNRAATFKLASVDACVFAIAMGVPNGIKPFLQMDPADGFDSINIFDKQEFSIATRRLYVDSKYVRSDGDRITNYFSSGNHILRPFNVDPNISDTVTGFSNETRHVAAPFLPNKSSTGIERNIFAKRPGLEFILRMRLRQQSEQAAFKEQFFHGESIADVDLMSLPELKLAASALLNDNNITSENILDKFKNIRNLEYLNIKNLTKTIKGVIELLISAIEDLDYVSHNIRWSPLPSDKGPEYGSEIASIIKPIYSTDLEWKIFNLDLHSQSAKRQAAVSDNADLKNTDFYLSVFDNLEQTYSKSLAEAIDERDNLQRLGNNALRTIEIITGEVSGLGLIDILAIYTALWAIDIDVLISMLDDRSFNRLYEFNNDLRTAQVQARRSSGAPVMSIDKAMQAFESQVINILSYADKIFQQKLGSPVNAEGGAVPVVRV